MRTVALDAMGGDKAPEATVMGAAEAVLTKPDLMVKLVGDQAVLSLLLARNGVRGHKRIVIVHAPNRIEDDTKVDLSIRLRTDASLIKAIDITRNGEADAIVSLGNTAVTAAAATLMLGRIPGMTGRPAIATILPRSRKRRTILLDSGAMVDCKPEQLRQFALLGWAYALTTGIVEPRIGLLSVGEEPTKGNAAVQEAHKLLVGTRGFIGNVQGHDIMNGEADVVVCDGFTGNAILKEAEGFFPYLKSVAKANWLDALLAFLLFRRIGKVLDYRVYGGCPLLGVQKVCIIGHGKSDHVAAKNAIFAADRAVENDLVGNTSRLFSE
jgi:phosphate acyltransferase